MPKYVSSGAMSALLLACLWIATINVQQVNASGTIYIRADGSVDPPTAPVQRNGDVYTLTGNITTDADGIIVERSNMILDGGGYTLQGAQGWPYQNGTRIAGCSNVTIQNMHVKDYANGIVLDSSSNCTVTGNVMANNGEGVWLAYSSNNTITRNRMTAHHAAAIYLWPASRDNSICENNLTNEYLGIQAYDSRNRFCHNNITNCWYGITLGYGSNNTVSDNTFSGAGLSVWQVFGSAVERNIVNGKRLVFLEAKSNQAVEDAGQVILVNCGNMTVNNLNLSNASYGLQLLGTSNSRITDNNIMANKWDGIRLWASSNNTFERNNITRNMCYGMFSGYSSNNLLRENHMNDNLFSFCLDGSEISHFVHDVDTSNSVDGKPIYYWINQKKRMVPLDAGNVILVNCTEITASNLNMKKNAHATLLAYTANCTITHNNMTANQAGIFLIRSPGNRISHNNLVLGRNGIYLHDFSNDNLIESNNMMANSYEGIVISSSSCNRITNNTIAKNWYGIWLKSSSNNTLHHNHIISNWRQLFTQDSVNVWDDGYPSGGNHWSDYNGTDQYTGSYQNATGADGIGDIAYVIDANNTDRYPLKTHDLSTTLVQLGKTVVGQNYPMSLCAGLQNQGYSNESFSLTIYANDTIIVSANVTLDEGESTMILLTWNTTGFAYGSYVITAYVCPVPAETDTTDNTLSDGTVTVSHVGDINGDWKVDIQDVARVSAAFGSTRIIDAYSPKYLQYWHSYACATCPHTPNADINDDGKVDIQDLARTSANFGWHR